MRFKPVLLLLLCACSLSASCSDANESSPQAPKGLLCELLRAPGQAVSTDREPEFGWVLNDPRRGAKQSGWQILVASSKERIESDQGDMWNSDKTNSSQSVDISY